VAWKIEFTLLLKKLGSWLEDVDSLHVRESLDSHSQPLTNTDLIELEQQRTYGEKEEIASEIEGCVSKEILIKELEQMFRNLETVKHQIMDLDPNVERSKLVRRALENAISCYRKLHDENKKATSAEMTLAKYFFRTYHIHFPPFFAVHFFNKHFSPYLLFIIVYISIYVHT
jgi:hypothetical protein